MTRNELEDVCVLFNRWNKRRALNRKDFSEFSNKKHIPLCIEWQGWPLGFMNFVEWSLLNGFNKKLVLDRKDGTKGYSPENCRWVTQQVNVWNSSSSKQLEYNGEIYPSIIELWRQEAPPWLPDYTFKARLLSGWSVEEAFTIPVSHGNSWRKR